MLCAKFVTVIFFPSKVPKCLHVVFYIVEKHCLYFFCWFTLPLRKMREVVNRKHGYYNC